MGSTIDFSTFNDDELLFGYQRVNRSRFPENFVACTHEITKRGLQAPEKFEINSLSVGSALTAFQKLGDGLSSFAHLVTKKLPASEV